MNNIQKAFKAKSGLRLAMGTGNVGLASQPAYLADDPSWNKQTGTGEAPTWWGMPSNTDLYKAGVTDGTSAGASALQARMDNPVVQAQVAHQAQQFAPAGQEAPPLSQSYMQNRQTSLMRDLRKPMPGLRLALGTGNVEDAEDAHNAQLVEVGGTVKDKQGRKDKDTVPVVLAKDEAVLPAKTVAALGGPEAVESLIARTNGKPPAGGLRAGQGLYTGWSGDMIDPGELQQAFRGQAQTPVIEPLANPQMEAARSRAAETAARSAAGTPATSAPAPTPTPTPAPAAAPATLSQATRGPITSAATKLGELHQTALDRGLYREAGSALNKANLGLAATNAGLRVGNQSTAIKFNDLGYDENGDPKGNRIVAAAKALPVAVGDLATGFLDTAAGDVVAGATNWLADKGFDVDRKRYGQINEAYRNKINAANLDGVSVPTTQAAYHEDTASVPSPSSVILGQSPGKKPVPVEPTKEYGNEGLSRALGSVNAGIEQARVDNAPGFTGATVSGDPTPGMGGYSVQGRSNLDATRLQAPNGGGFITGQPDAQGLRKAAFIPGGQTPYTAADGTPTADWTKTSAYADGTARAAREKQQLATLVADKAATGDRNRAFSLAQGIPGLDSVAKQGLDRFSAMNGLDPAGKADFINKEQMVQGQLAQARAQQAFQQEQLGLHRAQLQMQDRHQTFAEQRMLQAAQKQEMDARFDHANKLLKEAGFGDSEANSFMRFVNENHVGGERQPDGSFKKNPGQDFETLTRAEQQKMLPGLMGEYALWKQSNDYRTTSKSRQAFVEKPKSEYKPGEDKLGIQDVDKNDNGLWKLSSDDPKDTTLITLAQSKLHPLIGGISDKMAVGVDGTRVRRNDIVQNYYDKDGNLLAGKADVRRTLRDQSGAK